MVLSLGDADRDGSESSAAIPEDLVFDLLASSRRRELLRFLERRGGHADFSDATEAVAIAEGIDEDASPSEYKHVYVSLYQSHVPKLVEAGVLTHDKEQKTISLTERAGPLLEYLDYTPPASRRSLVGRLTSRLS